MSGFQENVQKTQIFDTSGDRGGQGVKKSCQAYLVEIIAVVSTLYTEYQNSIPFQRYDQFNFWSLDFYVGNKGIIFGDFFTIFAY